MACHELTALRLGLMNVLGVDDPAERQHEETELGKALTDPGPIQALTQAGDLARLKSAYGASLAALEEKVAAMPAEDAELPYYRALLITTKKVELELDNHLEGFARFWRDLDEVHHFIHEIYPAD
ncbi:MAG: DUF3209 family protein [Deltaproteobacteria bacterium]|nr:DUF3209 family protein [Deltaproteobacteria bacterium]